MDHTCGLVTIRSIYISDFSGRPCEGELIRCHSGVLATSFFIAVQWQDQTSKDCFKRGQGNAVHGMFLLGVDFLEECAKWQA